MRSQFHSLPVWDERLATAVAAPSNRCSAGLVISGAAATYCTAPVIYSNAQVTAPAPVTHIGTAVSTVLAPPRVQLPHRVVSTAPVFQAAISQASYVSMAPPTFPPITSHHIPETMKNPDTSATRKHQEGQSSSSGSAGPIYQAPTASDIMRHPGVMRAAQDLMKDVLPVLFETPRKTQSVVARPDQHSPQADSPVSDSSKAALKEPLATGTQGSTALPERFFLPGALPVFSMTKKDALSAGMLTDPQEATTSTTAPPSVKETAAGADMPLEQVVPQLLRDLQMMADVQNRILEELAAERLKTAALEWRARPRRSPRGRPRDAKKRHSLEHMAVAQQLDLEVRSSSSAYWP